MNFKDRVAAVTASQGLTETEALLLTDPLRAAPAPHASATGNPGVNSTYLCFLTTGARAFHKPFSGVNIKAAFVYGHIQDGPPMHEVAAWRLARALGAPWNAMLPPCVLRDLPPGGWGSLALGVDGLSKEPAPFTQAVPQVEAAAFWDCLTGQQDRHYGNYRWDGAARMLHLIDHGFCFAKPGDLYHASVFLIHRIGQGHGALSAQEIAVLQGLVASRDLLGLTAIVEPDRANAVADRADRMLTAGALLAPGVY